MSKKTTPKKKTADPSVTHLLSDPSKHTGFKVIDAADTARYKLNVILEILEHFSDFEASGRRRGDDDTGGYEYRVFQDLITDVRDELISTLKAHSAAVDLENDTKMAAKTAGVR